MSLAVFGIAVAPRSLCQIWEQPSARRSAHCHECYRRPARMLPLAPQRRWAPPPKAAATMYASCASCKCPCQHDDSWVGDRSNCLGELHIYNFRHQDLLQASQLQAEWHRQGPKHDNEYEQSSRSAPAPRSSAGAGKGRRNPCMRCPSHALQHELRHPGAHVCEAWVQRSTHVCGLPGQRRSTQ